MLMAKSLAVDRRKSVPGDIFQMPPGAVPFMNIKTVLRIDPAVNLHDPVADDLSDDGSRGYGKTLAVSPDDLLGRIRQS